MRRAGWKLILPLGVFLCLIGVAFFVIDALQELRARRDLGVALEQGLAAFRVAQDRRREAAATQIDALCQGNAVFRTILSTASLADADLGFPGFHDPRESLRDANLRLRSLLPALPDAALADVLVVTNAQGQLLYSRAGPEHVGDDLAELELMRETQASGSGVDVWMGPPEGAAQAGLVPVGPPGALYEVIGRLVVFDDEVHGVVLMGSRLGRDTLSAASQHADLALYAPGATPVSALDEALATDLEARLVALASPLQPGPVVEWDLAERRYLVAAAPLVPDRAASRAQVVALAQLDGAAAPFTAAALPLVLAGLGAMGFAAATHRVVLRRGRRPDVTPDDYARGKKLFFEASSLANGERERFLDSSCGKDTTLRRHVESLLAHHDAAGRSPRLSGPLSSSSAVENRFEAGDLFADRYRIVSPLGRGGMADVYRADDLTLGVPVAIKFLRAQSPQSLELLLNEVRLAREISHPAVCRVFDVGEADGRYFLTMEHVEGEDLASHLARMGRLPADKALELARELCGGLGAAHDKGVLHRDLKPANIMVDARGRARIVDFGIATRAGPDALIAGTPAYMAPEQLEPPFEATERTDLYALGLVLYELLIGMPVFGEAQAAELGELRAQRRNTAVQPPSERAPDVDPRLEAVILRALSEDPTERPRSALEMAQALDAAEPAGG